MDRLQKRHLSVDTRPGSWGGDVVLINDESLLVVVLLQQFNFYTFMTSNAFLLSASRVCVVSTTCIYASPIVPFRQIMSFLFPAVGMYGSCSRK